MKKSHSIPLLFALFLLAGSPLLRSGIAQDPEGDPFLKGAAPAEIADGIWAAPEPAQQIGILVEWVEMDARTGNKLLRKHMTQAGPAAVPNALRDEVEKMIDAEDAVLMDSNYVITKPGQRAKTESVDEIIYPTEYDPAELPSTVLLLGGTIKPTSPLPNSFEVRNVGSTLEVDPILDESGTLIDLNIAPEWVELTERDYQSREGATDSTNADIWQPKFFTMRVATALTVRNGESKLVTTLRPKTEGKLVFVFVQGSVIR